MIIFDIETGPLPDEKLKEIFEAPDLPKEPGEFDSSVVATGNLTDPKKIEAKHEKARKAHAAEVDSYAWRCKEIQKNAFWKFKDNAAKDAVTGEVLVVGYLWGGDKFEASYPEKPGENESSVIRDFWVQCEASRSNRESIVGLNIFDFDLPFLMRRSWILEVDVPPWIIYQDRYFDKTFIDLRKVWLCGQQGTSRKSSFDYLGRVFETGGKDVEGITGATFHLYWKNDRNKAIEYLKNDLEQPLNWALRMGVL